MVTGRLFWPVPISPVHTSTLVYGLVLPDLLVTVDQLPLVKIFSDQALENIKNPRLLNFKEKTMMDRFHIKHLPGKLNLAPDCTSRYYAVTPRESPAQIIDTASKAAFTSMYGNDPKLKAITSARIVAAAATDEKFRTIAHVIQNGFPKLCNDLPPIVQVFGPMREELYCLEGVTVKANKILIRRQLRAEVLESLHAAHRGVNGILANARQRLFWLGLDASIRQTRFQCHICITIPPFQPRELLMWPADLEFPFQQVVVDFADIQGKS